MPDKPLADHIRQLGDVTLCPFCGAYSTRSCDLIEEAGTCPWEEMEDAVDHYDFKRDRARDDRMLGDY